GPSTITDAPVHDAMPSELSSVSWSCSASGSATCHTSSGTGSIHTTGDLQGGASATFVVDATIDPTVTGTLSNSADVSMPGVGVDPTPENNVATDETTVVAVTDLSITKTDGTLTATPGGSTTYTMTAVNAGPPAAG